MNETKHPAGHVLQAYHDGELDPPTAAEVAAHCDDCESCRAELTALKELSLLLASAPAPELPRTVWHRVRPGRPRESRLRPVFGLVAGAAGIVLGILMGPIEFSAQETSTDLAWSENVAVWSGNATTSLLDVFDSEQE